MIKLITLLLLALTVVYGTSLIFGMGGSVEFLLLGYEIKTSFGFFLFSLFLLTLLIILFFNLLSLLLGFPSIFSTKYRKHKEDQNLRNMRLSYVALLSGDYKSAEKYAAHLKLTDRSNENLLIMQEVLNTTIQKQEGNFLEAERGYKHLLENKQTKFFATQGLLNSNFTKGDINKAIEYAEEAYKQKPDIENGAHSLLELYKKAEKWDKAEEFLKSYRRRYYFRTDMNNKFDDKKELAEIYFKKAILIKESALLNDDNLNEAYSLSYQSLRFSSDNEIYLELFVDLCKKLKKENKAKDAIENAWSMHPSQKLADMYFSLSYGKNDTKDFKEKTKAKRKLEILNPEGKDYLESFLIS